MGLTSALNTSLNGLALNETAIDVIGNNIANAGTSAFKSSKARFSTQLSRTLSVGSAPLGNSGGTNPRQIGLGAFTSAITKDFTQGSITDSTSPSDLAIEGEGFFVLDGPEGIVYSRNGNFSKNSENLLVNSSGMRVQGYGVDDNFNIVDTALVDLEIPLNGKPIAQASAMAEITGSIRSIGTAVIGTQGTLYRSEIMTDAGNGGAPITAATLLTDVVDAAAANPFALNDVLSFTPRKGGKQMEAQTVTIGAGTTLGDLMQLMNDTLGLHPQTVNGVPADAGPVGAGQSPGVTVTAAGEIQVLGNRGLGNAVQLSAGSITANGNTLDLNFGTALQTANGESASTDFVIYDSLGEAMDVRLTMVLESKVPQTTARYYIDSVSDSRTSTAISTGLITFDSDGNVNAGETLLVPFERTNTAAASPLEVEFDLSNYSSIAGESDGNIANATADGFKPGSLVNFVIDESGVINGEYNNGILKPLGQVVLATFNNSQGLLENGSDTFSVGVSSGSANVGVPGSFGYGTVRGGAVELSNTDIGRNLVDLIVASTNYRGNARVISSVQQLVDELLVLGR